LFNISQMKYKIISAFIEDISRRIADICNELHISVINCRYLEMWIKCENGLPHEVTLDQNVERRTIVGSRKMADSRSPTVGDGHRSINMIRG